MSDLPTLRRVFVRRFLRLAFTLYPLKGEPFLNLSRFPFARRKRGLMSGLITGRFGILFSPEYLRLFTWAILYHINRVFALLTHQSIVGPLARPKPNPVPVAIEVRLRVYYRADLPVYPPGTRRAMVRVVPPSPA